MGSIASAAVVAVPHPKWDERPIAVVTLAKGPVPDLLAKARRKQDLGFGMAREVDRGTKVG